jgi:hypothetical protein
MRWGAGVLVGFLGLLAIEAAGIAVVRADDGTVTVKIHEAVAYKKNNDDTFGPQQDFYAVAGIDFGPPLISGEIGNHDDASWSPPLTLSKTVAGKNQRFFDLYFELWDNDDTSADEDFDISPQNGPPPPNPLVPYRPNVPTGGFPHVRYDVCTGQMQVSGVLGSNPIPVGSNAVELNGKGTSNGTQDNWAALRIEVVQTPANWLPDDVAVKKVEIVQSVYNAARAVVDKETGLHVVIASTYPFDIPNTPVTGQITDGISTANVVTNVTIKGGSPSVPGITEVFLFDGTNAPQFKPQKSVLIGTGKVSGTASVIYSESVSPNAPPQLMDCANLNNTGQATDLPLMRTNDLDTVYRPFDYEEDLNFITSPQLQAMTAQEEGFRVSSWPLANVNSSNSYNQLYRDHGSNYPFFEPLTTLLIENVVAAISGIDRLVLSVRNGWFAQNAFRHQFCPSTAIGLSLGTFAPRAVLAEQGWFGNAVHELGHTYDLSHHPCSNQSPPFGPGCADEYNHPLTDGRIYTATGFDVKGNVLNNGLHIQPGPNYPGLNCPATPAWGRDICAPNLMDLNGNGGWANWLDMPSFQYLMENPIPHSDPPVVNVTGMIRLPNGQGDGTQPPLITGALPFFSYQFMGIQDVPDAPLSGDGEAFSGLGAFRIRLVTSAGVRDYRFNPRFFANDPAPDLAAGFSIDIPWDPSTMFIQLLGPLDGFRVECQNMYCPGDGMILDQQMVTPMPPSASDLRAGRDAAAPPTPPGGTPATPTIGPGHDAIVSWNAFDPDSPETRATLILMPPGSPAGGPSAPPVPVGMDIQGGTFRIPHDRMTDAPGLYTGRLLVSDGVNTTEIFSGPLLNICNLSNGGLDACNGIDDDCDGIVDDAPVPSSLSVQLNPQPFPPEGSPSLAWASDPLSQSYDVVYGDTSILRTTGGDFSRATLGCLADNLTGNSTPLPPVPPVGQAYWFDVRGNDCSGPGTYDPHDAGQVGLRDPGINASRAACRP